MNKTFKIQLASTDQCTGCAACASICPTNSITMREDREGFLQPHIDTKTCIGCHKCEKTCPIITPIKIPTDFETQTYAAINKDEAVRMRSSSGGIFYALAKWTIEQGGVVFGARFDENWEVMHEFTETLEGIEPLLRSKYLQSRIGETYQQAKKFLKEGRTVLFVGTPCQIGGLRKFLGRDYENLIMVDFICHGVPSSRVWQKFLKEKTKGDTLTYINFRDKRDGWNVFRIIITTTTTTREPHDVNLYLRGFMSDLYLRKSCYQCPFRSFHGLSDLTMGDFWGIENILPKMSDNKGTSVVLAHSSKGDELLNSMQIIEKCKISRKQFQEAATQRLFENKEVPRKRETIMWRMHYLPFISFERMISKDSLLVRVSRKISKIKNKFLR